MSQQKIAVIGAFDEKGVYGLGPHLPWGDETGRSCIEYDMKRVVHLTKAATPEGKKNVLVVGRTTAETFQMQPLPRRRLVVISTTLHEEEVNAGRSEEEKISVVRSLTDALQKALSFKDCGDIYFAGGRSVWCTALALQLCTHAFITIIKCDSVSRSLYKGEKVHHLAPEMLRHETYLGMKVEEVPFSDLWGKDEVRLEFRNYERQ